MKRTTSSEHFRAKSDVFFSDLAALLFRKEGVHLASVSAPQSLACYQTVDLNLCLQLRLVLIPLTNGRLLGRLSWLDRRGVDHVCCYVNEAFDCLIMASDGAWIKQTKSAEKLCINEFEALVA
ncbi:hypothetical protein MACH16_07650 [Marinomonas pontica]|uniref:Uncharacterized protein n=1 Tax=Marinomonas pontica TaxID=264739 RepID=A0ABM8FCF3_9GAMM|nr:hypothetical protein MACH16_07650 [Marinomonas pontica]